MNNYSNDNFDEIRRDDGDSLTVSGNLTEVRTFVCRKNILTVVGYV